jgi:hypothetical protein
MPLLRRPPVTGEGQMMKLELPGFDTLRYLAENDPERLELLRRTLTEQLIARSPEDSRRRLRGLQFEINARVSLAPNPIAACVAVSAMMHEALDHLQRAFFDVPEAYQAPLPPAKIIPFPQRN